VINYPSAGGTPGLVVEISDCAVYVAAGSTATGVTVSIDIAGIVNFHHNMTVLYGNGGASMNGSAGAAGSQSKNNIHIDARAASGAAWWQGASQYSVENNVYAAVTGMGSRIWWQTPGSGTATTITEWRSESGNDINSVVLTNGKELPADLIVYATGYGSMNHWLADRGEPAVTLEGAGVSAAVNIY
jgi:hypothetical protein